MKSSWGRFSVLATAVALLLGASYQVSKGEDSYKGFAIVLITSGLIVLGAWLTIEVWQHKDISKAREGTKEEESDG